MSTDFSALAKDTSIAAPIGVYVNGAFVLTNDTKDIRSPYNDALVATICQADKATIDLAIASGIKVEKPMRDALSASARYDILNQIADGIAARRISLARGITLESGKPIAAACGEVDRAVFTFRIAAEEAKRIHGEQLSLDWFAGNEKRDGIVIRQPRGLTVGITPFNFPINLVAHKVAPAIAAGNPIIIRPASQTALTSLHLAQIIGETDLPKAAFQVIPCPPRLASPLVEDSKIKFLSFTGSPAVGWSLKAKAGRKPITLELGGNAGNIVHHDANLNWATQRIIWGGFVNAGQTCISVQRIYVHNDIYDEMKARLTRAVDEIRYGDPLDQETFVGPVIDSGAADRIEQAIHQAVATGAKLLVGGTRNGNLLSPTLIESHDENLEISRTEIFGPVVVLSRYASEDEVIAKVNNSEYGLQAGLFTNNFAFIRKAMHELEVGGVNMNDVSTYRIDHMPYGGVKSSGFGREGLKYAIEEMTEAKLVTFFTP